MFNNPFLAFAIAIHYEPEYFVGVCGMVYYSPLLNDTWSLFCPPSMNPHYLWFANDEERIIALLLAAEIWESTIIADGLPF